MLNFIAPIIFWSNKIAKKIDIYDGLNKCFVAKTEQEFKYDFKTMKRDWVCVRSEGHWDYLLRY